MFCPSDLPMAKWKAQQLQQGLAKGFGDEEFVDFIIIVRAGYEIPHEETDDGEFLQIRPDLGHEPCYKVVFHRKEDNLHAEEYWRPDMVDSCNRNPREIDKAVKRIIVAFDQEAANNTKKH